MDDLAVKVKELEKRIKYLENRLVKFLEKEAREKEQKRKKEYIENLDKEIEKDIIESQLNEELKYLRNFRIPGFPCPVKRIGNRIEVDWGGYDSDGFLTSHGFKRKSRRSPIYCFTPKVTKKCIEDIRKEIMEKRLVYVDEEDV